MLGSDDPKQRAGGKAPGGARNSGSRGRSSGEPAVVALRMEQLTLWTIERVAKMPRAHKFTVGDRLVETCLEVTASLVDASYTRDKRALLANASRGLTRARLLVRLAHRLGLLSEKQSLYFGAESSEVGKMLGGWSRSQRARQPPTQATGAG